jgi:hypothetical protein
MIVLNFRASLNTFISESSKVLSAYSKRKYEAAPKPMRRARFISRNNSRTMYITIAATPGFNTFLVIAIPLISFFNVP